MMALYRSIASVRMVQVCPVTLNATASALNTCCSPLVFHTWGSGHGWPTVGRNHGPGCTRIDCTPTNQVRTKAANLKHVISAGDPEKQWTGEPGRRWWWSGEAAIYMCTCAGFISTYSRLNRYNRRICRFGTIERWEAGRAQWVVPCGAK